MNQQFSNNQFSGLTHPHPRPAQNAPPTDPPSCMTTPFPYQSSFPYQWNVQYSPMNAFENQHVPLSNRQPHTMSFPTMQPPPLPPAAALSDYPSMTPFQINPPPSTQLFQYNAAAISQMPFQYSSQPPVASMATNSGFGTAGQTSYSNQPSTSKGIAFGHQTLYQPPPNASPSGYGQAAASAGHQQMESFIQLLKSSVPPVVTKDEKKETTAVAEKKTYFCYLCRKSTDDVEIYHRHLKTADHLQKVELSMSDEKSFYCKCCDEHFRFEQTFSAHLKMQDHLEKKIMYDRKYKFRCSVCKESTNDKQFYLNHMNSEAHLERLKEDHKEKPYICNLCNRSSKTESSFIQHLESIGHLAKEKEGAASVETFCLLCNMPTNDLERHMKTDEHLRKLEAGRKDLMIYCHMCNDHFRTERTYTQHLELQLHLEREITLCAVEEKFACYVCKESTNDKMVYFHHMNSENHLKLVKKCKREKPYVCNLCRRNFKTEGSFVQHLQSFGHRSKEEGDVDDMKEKFFCTLCNKPTIDMEGYVLHLQTEAHMQKERAILEQENPREKVNRERPQRERSTSESAERKILGAELDKERFPRETLETARHHREKLEKERVRLELLEMEQLRLDKLEREHTMRREQLEMERRERVEFLERLEKQDKERLYLEEVRENREESEKEKERRERIQRISKKLIWSEFKESASQVKENLYCKACNVHYAETIQVHQKTQSHIIAKEESRRLNPSPSPPLAPKRARISERRSKSSEKERSDEYFKKEAWCGDCKNYFTGPVFVHKNTKFHNKMALENSNLFRDEFMTVDAVGVYEEDLDDPIDGLEDVSDDEDLNEEMEICSDPKEAEEKIVKDVDPNNVEKPKYLETEGKTEDGWPANRKDKIEDEVVSDCIPEDTEKSKEQNSSDETTLVHSNDPSHGIVSEADHPNNQVEATEAGITEGPLTQTADVPAVENTVGETEAVEEGGGDAAKEAVFYEEGVLQDVASSKPDDDVILDNDAAEEAVSNEVVLQDVASSKPDNDVILDADAVEETVSNKGDLQESASSKPADDIILDGDAAEEAVSDKEGVLQKAASSKPDDDVIFEADNQPFNPDQDMLIDIVSDDDDVLNDDGDDFFHSSDLVEVDCWERTSDADDNLSNSSWKETAASPEMVNLDSSDLSNISSDLGSAFSEPDTIKSTTRMQPYDDDYRYCDPCDHSTLEKCRFHGLMRRHFDAPVEDNDPLRAIRSLPAGLVMNDSSVSRGVFSLQRIIRGTVFGPFVGREVGVNTSNVDADCSWLVLGPYDPVHLLDGNDIATSNWLRYVRRVDMTKAYNLVAFQFKRCIYYRVAKSIESNSELVVCRDLEIHKKPKSDDSEMLVSDSNSSYAKALGNQRVGGSRKRKLSSTASNEGENISSADAGSCSDKRLDFVLPDSIRYGTPRLDFKFSLDIVKVSEPSVAAKRIKPTVAQTTELLESTKGNSALVSDAANSEVTVVNSAKTQLHDNLAADFVGPGRSAFVSLPSICGTPGANAAENVADVKNKASPDRPSLELSGDLSPVVALDSTDATTIELSAGKFETTMTPTAETSCVAFKFAPVESADPTTVDLGPATAEASSSSLVQISGACESLVEATVGDDPADPDPPASNLGDLTTVDEAYASAIIQLVQTIEASEVDLPVPDNHFEAASNDAVPNLCSANSATSIAVAPVGGGQLLIKCDQPAGNDLAGPDPEKAFPTNLTLVETSSTESSEKVIDATTTGSGNTDSITFSDGTRSGLGLLQSD